MPNESGRAYGLTTLCPIKLGTKDDYSFASLTRQYLHDQQAHACDELSPMAKVPNTYLCRFFVLDDVKYQGKPARWDRLKSPYLVFVAEIHGDLTDYLRGLWRHAEDFARKVWEHCVGFQDVKTPDLFIDYIKKCQVQTTFYFNGSTDDPLAEQLKSLYLMQEFSRFAYASVHKKPEQLQKDFQAFIKRTQPSTIEGPTWRAGASTLKDAVVEGAPHGSYSIRAGLERHIVPAGNSDRIVTKRTSDLFFGPSGLGFKAGFFGRLISWLARNGIQEQTGSRLDETDIEGCVKGWGQGPFSSRVFDPQKGVDEDQLERLIQHLDDIAKKMHVKPERYTDKVLAAFVASQDAEPYSSQTGPRTVRSLRERLGARFRGHIQWQSLCALCGQVDHDGVKHVTPALLRMFFTSEQPFFQVVVDRRQRLRTGELQVGERSGLLQDVPDHIDCKETDQEYQRDKSGIGLIVKIVRFMLCRTGSGFAALHAKPKKVLKGEDQ